MLLSCKIVKNLERSSYNHLLAYLFKFILDRLFDVLAVIESLSLINLKVILFKLYGPYLLITMTANNKTQFSKAKQSRSQKTLDDLLEAADELVNSADPKKFTTRSLADKSGYALGTLTTRLQSVENVFLYVIEKQRDKNIQSLVKSIEDFNEKKSIEELAELIFDQARELITKVNPKVIQFIESRFIKKNQFSSKYFHYADPIAHALVKSQKTNTSNTFRKVTEKEAKLIVRSLIMILERPFVEEDPIAGSKEHRRIVTESFVGLLGK